MAHWLIWLLLAIALFVVESVTVALVSLWFGLGALAAMITALITDNLAVQVSVFVVVSLITIAFTRPLIRKYIKINSTNVSEVIGKEGTVLSDIINDNGGGQAKVSGQVWTAKSAGGDIIKKHSRIVVREVRGVSLIVEQIK